MLEIPPEEPSGFEQATKKKPNPIKKIEFILFIITDGPKLKVKIKDGKAFVDDVEIKAAITAKNGVVYVVDTVLLAK